MNPKTMHQLKPGETLWDQGSPRSVKGLHLRAFGEKKVFYLYYRTRSGIQRRPKIGEYGVLDLIGARIIAHKWLVEVASGGDPSLDTQTLRLEMTVAALFTLVWEKHWAKNANSLSHHTLEVRRIFNTDIAPYFSGVKISELKPGIVREWFDRFRDKPTTGNRALEVLSKMMNFAEERELKPQNTNPCSVIKPFMEKARDRFATDDELRRIAEVLESEWNAHPREAAFIYLLMFTGARPTAVERVKWVSNSVVPGTNLIVLGKTGLERIPINKEAVDIVVRLALTLKDQMDVGDTLLNIKFPRKFWEKVRRKAGCLDLWARDLRRTFATTGMGAGLQMSSISELLNHKSTQTTKIYAKLDSKNREAAANKVGNAIAKILKTPRSHK